MLGPKTELTELGMDPLAVDVIADVKLLAVCEAAVLKTPSLLTIVVDASKPLDVASGAVDPVLWLLVGAADAVVLVKLLSEVEGLSDVVDDPVAVDEATPSDVDDAASRRNPGPGSGVIESVP